MADIGTVGLLLAAALSGYAALASVLGAWRRIPELVQSGRNAVYVLPVALGVSTGALVVAFVRHEFGIRYVAAHSSRAMEPYLTWVALYAGNEGSLLFLAFTFSIMAAVAVWKAPAAARDALPYTTLFLMGIALFYTGVMLTMANPFWESAVAPLDGQGMNPLLRHPGMFLHPPTQMMGLIGVGIPFAFAMGHLVAGRQGDEWVPAARAWGLVVWTILTGGILLGSWWAYTILGWGGYWGWDPVENAALLPWLPLTAFIHSIMVQRRRGMFRMWNVALITFAWGLAMYGMFMNRGGPVPSVHSFGQSVMGWTFLIFLGLNILGGLALFFWRYPRLRSSGPLDSPFSREAAFLANNLLFVMIALVVLWGAVYPLLSEAFQGETVTVGTPFYNVVTGPLFLALVVLMGVGPLLPWRRPGRGAIWRALRMPLAVGAVAAAAAVALGVGSPVAVLAFSTCGFVGAGIVRELGVGTRVRHRRGAAYPAAFLGLLASNRPRYGGYVTHLAIVMLAFSVTGSSFYSVQRDVAMTTGDRVAVQGYEIEFVSATAVSRVDRVEHRAFLQVYRGGRPLEVLRAGYTTYPAFSMSSTMAGIRSTPVEDLYVIASEFTSEGQAVFRVFVNPLVVWMWVAGPLMLLGTLISLWPERSRVSRSVSALRARPGPLPVGR